MRQFQLDKLFSLTEQTEHFTTDHIFGQVGNELYQYNIEIKDQIEAHREKESWPPDLVLFRDYWRFFCDITESNGPYYKEVINANKNIIIER